MESTLPTPITAPLARVRKAGAPSTVTIVSHERAPLIEKGCPAGPKPCLSPSVELLRMPAGMRRINGAAAVQLLILNLFAGDFALHRTRLRLQDLGGTASSTVSVVAPTARLPSRLTVEFGSSLLWVLLNFLNPLTSAVIV